MVDDAFCIGCVFEIVASQAELGLAPYLLAARTVMLLCFAATGGTFFVAAGGDKLFAALADPWGFVDCSFHN